MYKLADEHSYYDLYKEYFALESTEENMDSNTCSNDSESVGEFLRQLEEKSNTAMIPAVVMLVIFSVVGLVGNILVLVVYSKKVHLNPTKVLIMTMATFDLVANVVAIPTAITTMLNAWNFHKPVLCKVTASLGSFTALGGALCLLTVAVIRYRKVCRPYEWQVTNKQAVAASLTSVLLSLILSIPYMVLYGVRAKPTTCPNIKGHDCFADDLYASTIWPILNNILSFIIYLVMSVSMVAMYTLIGVMAWKHSKLHGTSEETSIAAVSYKSTSQLLSSVTIPLVSSPNTSTEQTNSTQADTANLSNDGCVSPFLSSEHPKCKATQDNTISPTAKKPNSTITEKCEVKTSKASNPKFVITPTNEIERQPPFTNSQSINQLVYSKQVIAHDRLLQSTVPESQNLKTQVTWGETKQKRENSSLNDFSNEGVIQWRYPRLQIDTPTKDSNPEVSLRKRHSALNLSDPANMEKTRLPVGRMTAMLIIISAIYVLSFLPFLILIVYKGKFPERYASLNQIELAFFNIAYRLYFLQSATNPIVYSFCDTHFRRNCIQLLTCKRMRHS